MQYIVESYTKDKILKPSVLEYIKNVQRIEIKEDIVIFYSSEAATNIIAAFSLRDVFIKRSLKEDFKKL